MQKVARVRPTWALIQNHMDEIRALCQKYGVRSLRLFGSVVRNEARTTSDIDLLVAFEKPATLLDLVRLEQALSEVLGTRVDLVTERALSLYIRPQILQEARVIYESSAP